MALTMTRTRTQTALTKLALMVASIHGELAFVEDLIATCAGTGSAATAAPGIRTNTGMQAVLPRLERRRQELVHNRDALYATIRQFDPKIAPQDIGVSADWTRQYGSRNLLAKGLLVRYLDHLA